MGGLFEKRYKINLDDHITDHDFREWVPFYWIMVYWNVSKVQQQLIDLFWNPSRTYKQRLIGRRFIDRGLRINMQEGYKMGFYSQIDKEVPNRPEYMWCIRVEWTEEKITEIEALLETELPWIRQYWSIREIAA